jgi:hypothetical protein
MKAFTLYDGTEREIRPLLLVGSVDHHLSIHGLVVYAEALVWEMPKPPKRSRLGWTLHRFRGEATSESIELIYTEGAKLWAEPDISETRDPSDESPGTWQRTMNFENELKRRILRASLLGQFSDEARYTLSEFVDDNFPQEATDSPWNSIAAFGRASRNPIASS